MLSANQTEIDLEQILAALQSAVMNLLPENWLWATVTAEIDDDESGLTYGRYCLSNTPEQWQSFDTDYTYYIIFDALRQRIQHLLGNQWRKVTVKLSRYGALAISFEYA